MAGIMVPLMNKITGEKAEPTTPDKENMNLNEADKQQQETPPPGPDPDDGSNPDPEKDPKTNVEKSATRKLLEQQSDSELQKSKRSFAKLVEEHEQKLSDYIKNPDACDNQGKLPGLSSELREKNINGRINALNKQLEGQNERLAEAIDILKSRGLL